MTLICAGPEHSKVQWEKLTQSALAAVVNNYFFLFSCGPPRKMLRALHPSLTAKLTFWFVVWICARGINTSSPRRDFVSWSALRSTDASTEVCGKCPKRTSFSELVSVDSTPSGSHPVRICSQRPLNVCGVRNPSSFAWALGAFFIVPSVSLDSPRVSFRLSVAP